MTFMQWLLKEAIWFTIAVVILYYVGYLKTQDNMIGFGLGWFATSFLIYVIRRTPKQEDKE